MRHHVSQKHSREEAKEVVMPVHYRQPLNLREATIYKRFRSRDVAAVVGVR